jgi:hypothetical protein
MKPSNRSNAWLSATSMEDQPEWRAHADRKQRNEISLVRGAVFGLDSVSAERGATDRPKAAQHCV